MSAVAMVAGDDGAIFAADQAIYAADTGNVVGFMSKLFDLPAAPAVFGCVGVREFGPMLHETLSTIDEDFDHLLAGTLMDAVRAVHHDIVDHYPDASIRSTMVISGFSRAAGKFTAYKLHTAQKYEFEPWTLYPAGTYLSTNPGEEALTRFGVDFDDGSSKIDLAARLVCANRSTCGASDQHDGVYGVGGDLEIVVLHAGGIKRWIAHSWPDPLGEPVDPKRGEPMPTFPLQIP